MKDNIDLDRQMREKNLKIKVRVMKFIFIMLAGVISFTSLCSASWEEASDYFHIKKVNGRKIFIDPAGKPFYSIGMVYAYGPESPSAWQFLTSQKVIADLQQMKTSGFNTLNLYGTQYLDEMLKWCEKNELAIYFRTKYVPEDFPDFMDIEFRERAKHFYDDFLKKIKEYHCVLAIDMDQRWMFADVDWSGKRHPSIPKLGKASLYYFPKWLKLKYKKIKVLNEVWKKNYKAFSDVFADDEITKEGEIQKLAKEPWRCDVIQYTQWTINDFLKDLTEYLKTLDPNHLITYTTELPETFVFPVSTKKNSGIDFISPVHYNSDFDFNFDRDWISLGKLLFQCKFHYDLNNNMPVYISEAGFRTEPLNQTPSSMGYASAKPKDKLHQAELYLRQSSVLNVLPFVTGWAYFKWYDKWFEGDFGYINDDRSLKPMSKLGNIINNTLPINMIEEKEPALWIYYPEYAFGSSFSSFPQYKSLMMILQNDFIAEYEKMLNEVIKYIDSPNNEILKERIFTDMVDIFNKTWVPLKFVSHIPRGKKPIILAGRALEQLSLKDRKKLVNENTIIFAPIGVSDERYNNTKNFYLEILDISQKSCEPENEMIELDKYIKNIGYTQKNQCANCDVEFLTYRDKNSNLCSIKCDGQKISIPSEYYTKVHFLIGCLSGDICEKVRLVYTDGTMETKYFAPTISSLRDLPSFGHLGIQEVVDGKKNYITHLEVSLNPMKKISSIVLPDNPEVCIFSMGLSKYGSVENTNIEVESQGLKFSGESSWLCLLNPDSWNKVKVLAKFANGYPAIVQSKDGKHVVFLYDALTREGKENEVSKYIGIQNKILNQILKYWK